jgi:hypothetical protein
LIEKSATADDIKDQLNRLLKSNQFRNAHKTALVLQYLVDRSQHDPDNLNSRKIAIEVFREPANFDTFANSRVRVAVNRVRTALKLYYAGDGADDPVLFEIPSGQYKVQFTARTADDSWPVTEPHHHQVKRLKGIYWHYQTDASAPVHKHAFELAKTCANLFPEDATILGVVAELAMDARASGYGDNAENLDIAHRAIDQATSIDPDDPQLLISKAFADIAAGDLKAAAASAVALEQIDDDALSTMGTWLKTIATRVELSASDVTSIEKHAGDLGWLRHAPFLAAYRLGDYEGALMEAVGFGMPTFMWGPLDRAAAFGQLGLKRCAEHELDRIQQLNPQFEHDPKSFLSSYVPFEDDMDHILDGLHRGGL